MGDKDRYTFFLPMEKVPTYTAQQRRAAVNRKTGNIFFYKDKKGKSAEELYKYLLCDHVPVIPFCGAVELTVTWCFNVKDKKKHGNWKTTTPDTDNLIKLLKDCMTDLGFWSDDKIVVKEHLGKMYTSNGGILISIKKIDVKALDNNKINELQKHYKGGVWEDERNRTMSILW